MFTVFPIGAKLLLIILSFIWALFTSCLLVSLIGAIGFGMIPCFYYEHELTVLLPLAFRSAA